MALASNKLPRSALVENFDSLNNWLAYQASWLRVFGPPEVMICDGGPEYQGDFERRLELSGIFQQVTDAESPWQNGKAERHGQWIKDLLEVAISNQFIQSIPESRA